MDDTNKKISDDERTAHAANPYRVPLKRAIRETLYYAEGTHIFDTLIQIEENNSKAAHRILSKIAQIQNRIQGYNESMPETTNIERCTDEDAIGKLQHSMAKTMNELKYIEKYVDLLYAL